jgi:hypothetical protein
MIQNPTTVRRFSLAGPCITLGRFVKRTDKFLIYVDRYDGKTKRVSHAHDLAHTDPCPSCRDHARTQYPNGYMD